MKYPEECPVFEVLQFMSNGRVIPAGEHVEGVGPVDGGYINGRPAAYHDRKHIGIRHPDHSMPGASRHPEEGWLGAAVHPTQLRPLTRAAREMLELVSE